MSLISVSQTLTSFPCTIPVQPGPRGHLQLGVSLALNKPNLTSSLLVQDLSFLSFLLSPLQKRNRNKNKSTQRSNALCLSFCSVPWLITIFLIFQARNLGVIDDLSLSLLSHIQSLIPALLLPPPTPTAPTSFLRELSYV